MHCKTLRAAGMNARGSVRLHWKRPAKGPIEQRRAPAKARCRAAGVERRLRRRPALLTRRPARTRLIQAVAPCSIACYRCHAIDVDDVGQGGICEREEGTTRSKHPELEGSVLTAGTSLSSSPGLPVRRSGRRRLGGVLAACGSGTTTTTAAASAALHRTAAAALPDRRSGRCNDSRKHWDYCRNRPGDWRSHQDRHGDRLTGSRRGPWPLS